MTTEYLCGKVLLLLDWMQREAPRCRGAPLRPWRCCTARPKRAPWFLAVLAVHVPAGLAAVITGAGAAFTRKGSTRHVRLGRWCYAAITLVFATAAILAVLRWREDWDLLVLGALAYAGGTIGFAHHVLLRQRPPSPGLGPRAHSGVLDDSQRGGSTLDRARSCSTERVARPTPATPWRVQMGRTSLRIPADGPERPTVCASDWSRRQ